jgi:S-formylglutathione hydrolase
MGGHGALTLYLSSKTKQYRSASAFAPASNPSKSPWGQKSFDGFLQGGVSEGKDLYDATELISKCKDPLNVLVDYVCPSSPASACHEDLVELSLCT